MLQYRPGHPGHRWSVPRHRLLALVLGASGLAVILGAGIGLSAYHLAHPSGGRSTSGPGTSSSGHRSPQVSAAVARARDALAARKMPDTGTGHEWDWPDVSTQDPGPAIQLPPSRGVDALGVPIGFPQTPQGALAQLAGIDAAALRSASLPRVRALITVWAAPGGPTARSWSGVAAMAGLLESAGLSGAGSPALQVRARPAMGLIKGQIGDDFVVACIDFAVDISYRGDPTATVSVDCQRMLWQQDRWVIGPGAEPAQATQVWPDTDAAIKAGFRDLNQT